LNARQAERKKREKRPVTRHTNTPVTIYYLSHLYKIILWRGGKAPGIQCNRQDLWDSNLILQVLYLSVWLGLCGTINPNFLRCRALVFFPPYRLSLSCQIVLDTSDYLYITMCRSPLLSTTFTTTSSLYLSRKRSTLASMNERFFISSQFR